MRDLKRMQEAEAKLVAPVFGQILQPLLGY
jgi:hypothetical protein